MRQRTRGGAAAPLTPGFVMACLWHAKLCYCGDVAPHAAKRIVPIVFDTFSSPATAVVAEAAKLQRLCVPNERNTAEPWRAQSWNIYQNLLPRCVRADPHTDVGTMQDS